MTPCLDDIRTTILFSDGLLGELVVEAAKEWPRWRMTFSPAEL